MTIPLRPLSRIDRREPLLRELLGDILRRKRAEHGRTLRDVADDARVSLAYLSEVERGQKEASSEILDAMCRALDMTILELVSSASAELELRQPITPLAAPLTASSTVGSGGTGTALTLAA